MLLKGLDVRKALLVKIQEEMEKLPVPPKLVMVRAGEDPADIAYEKNAGKLAEKLKIRTEHLVLSGDISHEDFMEAFRRVNADPDTDGILLFRPLPKQIREAEVMKAMDPEKDVDFITDANIAALFSGKTGQGPCTAEAVMEMLHYAGISPEGKRAVVVGRSMVIGKPLSAMLLRESATVTICHTRTRDLRKETLAADLLFVCTGKAGLIDGSYVKPGAAVFDVGISVLPDGSIAGDCVMESVSEKAGLLTPVPGGVGSVTTAVLMHHVVLNALKRRRTDG